MGRNRGRGLTSEGTIGVGSTTEGLVLRFLLRTRLCCCFILYFSSSVWGSCC